MRPSSRHYLYRSLVVVATLLMVGMAAFGDVTASITGVVKDPSGAVIPHVKITVVNVETGIHRTTATNAQGSYSFPALPIGDYALDASAPGFKEYKQTGIRLDVNTALAVDFSLTLGSTHETVTVNASAVHIETTGAQLGEVISGKQMTDLPLNGRNYTDLLALQPGVTPFDTGGYNGPSISGQRGSANGFMVNGANVEESGYMGPAVVPNLDSLAEFRILTSNYDAEYGNYSGGQVNVITKSGTNQFHGDLFDFLRNTSLDARNYFSPGRGKFIQNQFGGTVGGPIIHDKLFFFVDYQGTRQILGLDTGDIPVPSGADRAGNLADIADQLTGTVNGGYWANALSQSLGYTVTPGEPYYTPGCTSAAACVFPNAVIPQSAMSTPALNLLKYIPMANSGAFYTTSAYNQTLADDLGSIRLDFNSQRFGRISAYYFLDNTSFVNPYGSSFPGFGVSAPARSQLVNFGDTKTISPTSFNEFHLNYMRWANSASPQSGLGVTLSSLGFVTGPGTPGIFLNSPFLEGVPPISFNNFAIGVAGAFDSQANNMYQVIDNVALVRGSHTIKFGGEAQYDQIAEKDFGQNNGTFGFYGTETGSDFADFLIGAPSVYNQGVQEPLYTRTHYVGLYGQDSWRATPSLNLSYGLRWEITAPWSEAHNQLETLVPGLQSKVFPGAPTGWVFPGDPGIPPTIAPIRYRNFAPRIGLAYAPSASGGLLRRILGGSAKKTSIRAGYGLFYSTFADAGNFRVIGDAPFGYYWSSPTPPLFDTPFIDRATGNNEGQRFPVPFPPLNVSPSNPDNSINWSQFLPISGSPVFATTTHVPYGEDYSFSIQRQIGTNNLLSVAYVGTQGHALVSSLESNAGNPALCLSVSNPSQVIPGGATCGPFGENGVYTMANGQVINGTRQPFGNDFGSNQYFTTIGNSSYNSLQVSFRRTSGRLAVLVGYTYSKAMDDGSGLQSQIIPTNHRLSRAIADFDLTHNFVASYRYELPFDRLFGHNRLASGWAITGITRFTTGTPVTLTEQDDRSLLGVTSAGAIDRPNYTPGNLDFTDPRTGRPFFNTSLFSQENLGQIGTSSRQFFYGPGLANTDLALLKNIGLTESKTLQLRFEFFNVFNTTQFAPPDGNINSSSFGYVLSAGSPRIAQLAAKILF